MVDLKLAEIALIRASGSTFERFFQAFLAGVYGDRFGPIGGTNDGGADGFLEPVHGETASSRFFQASVQENYDAKIRQTLSRLQETGRTVSELVYCSSRTIHRVDQEVDRLTDELGITVRIRDQRWFLGRINENAQTRAAFDTYLAPGLAFLRHVGGATLLDTVEHQDTRALFVFLEQELARRRNNSDVLQATTDSLILWALEETDPEAGRFMTRPEILSRIESVLPSAKQFIRGTIDHRLEKLSSRDNPTGREIRWHRKENKYCLPFETRQKVEAENAEDELLKKHFIELQRAKAMNHFLTGERDNAAIVASVSHRAIEFAFEKQGIELAGFLQGTTSDDQPLSMSDHLERALEDVAVDHVTRIKIKDVALDVLRTMLYESEELERAYLGKLSRSYALLFTLRTDARVIEYFRSLSTRLVLYVGADILVRALSEHFLRPADQMTRNLLRILKEAGAKLILAQTAAEEVHANVRISDHEFNNLFKWTEPTVTLAVARQCSKILVRSYFYAKLSPPEGVSPPSGWTRFVDQFVTYGNLHSGRGCMELQDYLCRKFGLTLETEEQMHAGVSPDHLTQLTESLVDVRPQKGEKSEVLAKNDALQVLRIYAKRKEINDRFNGPFGYKVWWLTHEVHVMRVTGPLVRYYNARYIMRPEFVLNFISLAPTAAEVRTAYEKIFPTLLSVKLSNRMRDDVFHDVMNRYKRACQYDPERIEVKMQELTNRLKGDNYKQYEIELQRN